MRLEQTRKISDWLSVKFQFHKGAIRTHRGFLVGCNLGDFNSIKVRLERTVIISDTTHLSQFQFHKGAIRTHVAEQVTKEILNFNSIKVRLEHNKSIATVNATSFQFHKGAIRTLLPPGAQGQGRTISIP